MRAGGHSTEADELVAHNAKLIGLDRAVQEQLELAGLEGYQKSLKALEQSQQKELEQYRKAGADVLALERLHAEQRKALKASAAKELMSSFAEAPGFAGTGGASGPGLSQGVGRTRSAAPHRG